MKKLLTLELSAEEFAAVNQGQVQSTKTDLSLIKYIPTAKSFYESAQKRETAMIENAVGKIDRDGEETAVLIAGGFHADSLTKAFSQRGYTVMNITPRFTPADSKTQQQHYFDILKYKWGQGPTNPSQGGIIHNAKQ